MEMQSSFKVSLNDDCISVEVFILLRVNGSSFPLSTTVSAGLWGKYSFLYSF